MSNNNKLIIGIIVGIAALFIGVLLVVFLSGFLFYRSNRVPPPVENSAPVSTTQPQSK